MTISILSILGLVGFGVADFFGENRESYEKGFAVRRYLLSLSQSINLPIVQSLLVGLVWIGMGKKTNSAFSNSDESVLLDSQVKNDS